MQKTRNWETALKKEFDKSDKEAVDHEKDVDELRRLKRKNGETPAQLAWRIEKLMGKAYPELCGSKDEAAKKTHLQMPQDTFVGAIDEAMSQKLKTNPKHRGLNLIDKISKRTRAPRTNLLSINPSAE